MTRNFKIGNRHFDLHTLSRKLQLVNSFWWNSTPKSTGIVPLVLGGILMLMASCDQKIEADSLVYGGTIYSADSTFAIHDAMVVSAGKIVAVGSTAELKSKFNAKEEIDATGKFIYPGFIDAHAHFVGYGMGLQTANLVGTKSWEEVLEKLQAFAKTQPNGWLVGRGWDQNDWDKKEFPTFDALNTLFPDRPVLLERVDGHASIVNQTALNIAGIDKDFSIQGGQVVKNDRGLTGLLIDRAADLVISKIPPPDWSLFKEAMLEAEKNCFSVGLTTIVDCGLHHTDVEKLEKLQDSSLLRMRLYVMMSDVPENYDYLEKRGRVEKERMHIRSFKLYGDGALGSRGACLLQPYHDQKNHYGFLLQPAAHFDSMAARIAKNGFQMCTHAIGDSGNRTILQTYARYLKPGNDERWRIEHAQVVHPDDFNFFGKFNIIPSVQPTHATSDMYWAEERLGKERMAGAYAYQSLLRQNGWIPLGTDFPVEDISPFKTFFAAVARKDQEGYPKDGFRMEEALSRKEALWGMTLWAAKSNFEEKFKGSIEVGKWADFILLDKDLMNAPLEEILQAKVQRTYVQGELVFNNQ